MDHTTAESHPDLRDDRAISWFLIVLGLSPWLLARGVGFATNVAFGLLFVTVGIAGVLDHGSSRRRT